MDIEEGEIIISDVSSDESNDHQSQPWNKDKFQVELDSFRYQSTSRSNTISLSTRRKGQHECNETSFCRKTFSWRNCLGKESGQKNRSRNKSIRSETFSSDSVSRTQNQRNLIRQKYNDHLDQSHIHESQRSKKQKRKGRSEMSHSSKHKPERTLRQLINHCENRSLLINEKIQLSRTPLTATVTQENTSLMQKLITSGLAKPPVRSEAPSEVGRILSSPESETCVKKEKISVINVDSKDNSDDSEIEVIIPPKKVPPLVTLDSDGEEVEQLGSNSANNALSLETLNHEPQQTLGNDTMSSEVNNNPTPDQSKTSNENKSDDINLNNNELSAGNSPFHKASEFVNDSSDSLGSELVSELCDVLPYSPSSPSSCNSSDVNLTKDPSSQSPPSIGSSASQNLQFEENSCKDFSTVSNEEIISEIWLDLNGQQTSGNLDKTKSLTSLQTDFPRKNLKEGFINSESINNENPSFDNDNSLSALVENFIMCSTSIAEDVNTEKQQMGIDEQIQSRRETICENESEKCSQRKFDELINDEDVKCLLPSETGNVQNKQLLTKAIVAPHSQSEGRTADKNQTNHEQCNNGHTYDSFNLNKKHLSTCETILSDDEKLCSPSSSYSCVKIIENDCAFTLASNSNHPSFITSKHLPDIETPASESKKDNLTKSSPLNLNCIVLNTKPINTEGNSSIDSTTVTDNKESGLKGDREILGMSNENNNQNSHKECINKNIGISGDYDDDEEDNVSQLRMIALQTKGKAINKETKPDECTEKSKSHLSLNQNDNNVSEPNISECTPQNVLDDDDDVLQLRVAALKSAVMKKHGERKKRGLLVKKRKRITSGPADDIFTSPESNLTLEQDNSSPLSPAKSSASLQGEEDMELAESDFGEDNIEEINASSVEENHKLSGPVCKSSCSMSDSSARTYEIPSAVDAHSRNISLIVPPQPLPPGVDGDCPELINRTIFTSVLPPPPPPPLPPPPPPTPLVFSPILPPPPPPPFPSPNLESSSQFSQPPLFSIHTNSGSEIDSLGKICPQKESTSSSNFTFSDPPYAEGLKNNNPIDDKPSCNDLLVSEKSKKLNAVKSQVRGNLITVPVVKNILKPVLTKNQLRKRKRKRNKSVEVLTESGSNLLCITKPPGKSSVKLGGSSNLKTAKQTNIQSGCGINTENNPEISCASYDGSTPVILCNTNPHVDNWKVTDNLRDYEDIWQKQEPIPCGMSSAKSNLSEETSMVEDDIDLSEMIVLDEVGMSPEHKSKNEGSWDYSSPQEEDEDENTLRIRALTSLSPKPVIKKLTSYDISRPRPHIQPETYRKSWETNEPGKSEYNTRRGSISPRVKPKEVHSQRRVVGIDTSKYRLTRTLSNEQRRSVVHGRESLKVVVPTHSPPHTLPSEPSLPVVKRLVINVDKDTDSEEECEWTRKIRIQDTNTSLPPGPVVDYELERSIDELLMRARNSVDSNSSPSQNQGGKARNSTLKPENRKISESDFSLHDTPLKLLPKEKQEEYKRLKAILEMKEREIQQSKKISSVKAPEKSKPLLQHVLINENNKQNQKGQQPPQGSSSYDDKRRKRDQSMDYVDVRNRNSSEMKNYSEIDTLSHTVQGPAKNNRQKNLSTDPSGKGNCTRKVLFNDTNKLNVNSLQKSSVSSHELSSDEDLQSKVLKSTNEYMRVAKNIICENSETSLSNQQKTQEASQSKLISSSSKQLSTVSSKNTQKQMQENFGSNMQQQRITEFDVKDSDNTTKYSNGSRVETEKENSLMGSEMSQSNSKEEIYSSAFEAPQIFPVQADFPSQGKLLEEEGRESEEDKCSTKEKADILSLEKAWDSLAKLLEKDGIESEKDERSTRDITKIEATTNIMLNYKLPDKNIKSSDSCKEPFDDENIVNFKKSKTNTGDTHDIRCQMDEGGRNPLEKARTKLGESSSSFCSELEKQGEIKAHMNNKENSDSKKDNDAKSVEEILSSDILHDAHAAHEELLQNECPREELAAKKSELLSERFGLLDDLSEMAESLDDLDSHQGRLEQSAVEISALRRALRAAEDTLREQLLVAQSLESRLHDTHTAVSARYTNITHLEMTLHHASYEIPTTAQKLMSKKVKQVKDKIDKVKGKRSIIRCLINNPDTTKEELTEMHANLLMRKTEDSGLDDAKIINNLWLQDPKTSQLEGFPVTNISADCHNKTDSETQTLSSSSTEGYDAVLGRQVSDHLKPYKDDQQSVQALDSVESSSRISSENPHSVEETACLQTSDASEAKSELEIGNLLRSGSDSSSITPVQTSKPSEMESENSLCSGSNSSSIKSDQSKPYFTSRSETEDISSKLKKLSRQTEEKHAKSSERSEEEFYKEPSASKRSITQVSGISEAVAKKPNLTGSKNTSSDIGCNVTNNTRNLGTNESVGHGNFGKKSDIPCKSGTSTSKSKFQYKSILQYRGPSSRADKSRGGQAVLCPYDLTGRCQDKECKFQHFN